MRNLIYSVGACSNTLGSVNNRWSRGRGRGGASSAARNAFQRRVEPKMLTIGQSFPCAIQRALQHELADRAPGGLRGGVQHPLRFRRQA
jgi:hypothetical protein